jgi:hypothetical protein
MLLVSVLIMFIGGAFMSYLADYLQKKRKLNEPLDTPEKRDYAKNIISVAVDKSFRDVATRKLDVATQAAMEGLKSDLFIKIDSGKLQTFNQVLKFFEHAIRRAKS